MSAYEGADLTVKSFSSSKSTYQIDRSEVSKTPKGLVLIGLPSRVIAVLPKFQLMARYGQNKSNCGISICNFAHRQVYWYLAYPTNFSSNGFVLREILNFKKTYDFLEPVKEYIIRLNFCKTAITLEGRSISTNPFCI